MASHIERRKFLATLGGAAAWPFAARAQQPAMPVIGLLYGASPDPVAHRLRAFRQGLKDSGYVEGENVAIEYRWAENQVDRLPVLAAELARQPLAVIVASGGAAVALRVKAATTTIPIVFLAAEDPVRLGLVASLARPGGNLTGINFFSTELVAKRLELLRELLPAGTRVAVLVNPANVSNTESTLRDVEPAARAWDCKSRSSTRAPAARSMRPSQPSCASGPTRFLSAATPSSTAVASRWSNWRPTIMSPRHIRDVSMPKSAD